MQCYHSYGVDLATFCLLLRNELPTLTQFLPPYTRVIYTHRVTEVWWTISQTRSNTPQRSSHWLSSLTPWISSQVGASIDLILLIPNPHYIKVGILNLWVLWVYRTQLQFQSVRHQVLNVVTNGYSNNISFRSIFYADFRAISHMCHNMLGHNNYYHNTITGDLRFVLSSFFSQRSNLLRVSCFTCFVCLN